MQVTLKLMNPTIEAIYESRQVTGATGVVHPLEAEVDRAEGAFLHRIIAEDPSVVRTLEVGCAYGLSSLHICEALKGRPEAQHTIIDPFQNTQWDGVGVGNLTRAGVDFFRLIEKRSEFALPEVLAADGEGKFDFVFIDGWHTFDHTLLDGFYATRLLRVGGYLVIDDIVIAPVRRATDYLESYPCYRRHASEGVTAGVSWKRRAIRSALGLLPRNRRDTLLHPDFARTVFNDEHSEMIALQKIAEDQRAWDWYPRGF